MTVNLPDDPIDQLSAKTSNEHPTGRLNGSEDLENAVRDVVAVGPAALQHLRDYGYETVSDLREATVCELNDVPTIGEETATQLLQRVTADALDNRENNTD
jgi:ERCC4-type nuclease